MRSSVHVSLDTDILEKFTELSQKANKSRNQIISDLVLEWMEDYEDYLLAEQVMNDIEEGIEETITHEEFKAQLHKDNHD